MRITFIFVAFPVFLLAQPNCNLFLMNQDTACYEACNYVDEHKEDYSQFDWRQIAIFEKTIEMCPKLAYPYREIGSSLVKSGNFVEWKKYIDKAVELDPLGYLNIRASNRFKFFADYKGTIEDIRQLESMLSDIGSTSEGLYHLKILEGLCYKELDQTTNAIRIIERQISQENHYLGIYDYLHLGVLYIKSENYQKAIDALVLQVKENDMAEARYYLALAHKKQGNESEFQENIKIAKSKLEKDNRMADPYNELTDQIDIQDINHLMMIK